MTKESAEKLLARWKEMVAVRRELIDELLKQDRTEISVRRIAGHNRSANAIERCISELETALRGVDVPEPGTQWIEAEKLQNGEMV